MCVRERKTSMEDTDWRPSACPLCEKTREAARTPVCRNPKCDLYVGEARMTTSKENKRYVWIRADGEAKIIDTDIVELWQGPYFDREKDRIYELGAEVEIKVSVAVKNQTVYRDFRDRSYAEGSR
jgi:hypothetical protein